MRAAEYHRFGLSPRLRRVCLCFALLMVINLAGGLFAINQLTWLYEEAGDIREDSLPSTAVLGRMAADIGAFRAAEASFLAAGASDDITRREDAIRTLPMLANRITANVRIFESLPSSIEEKRLFIEFLGNWYAYARLVKAALAQPFEASAALDAFAQTRPIYDKAEQLLSLLIDINTEESAQSFADMEDVFDGSVQAIGATMALAAALLTALLLYAVWRERD